MTEKHTFHVPRSGFDGRSVRFPEAEARHAVRVLRLGEGDDVQVVDGEGGRCLVRIDAAGRGTLSGHVIEERDPDPPRRPRLTLCVGLLKHAGRFETMLEKAAEIGVERIVPLVTERTETRRLRMDRAEAVLVAAMKQSGRARLVKLAEPTPLGDLLASVTDTDRFVCHEAADLSAGLGGPSGDSACVLVGPEGGFADRELEAAVAAGFRTVRLGPTRLRTETAAIVAAALILARPDS